MTDKLAARIKAAAAAQCPEGYSMTIKDSDEWKALAAAWNQGIDAHLEALTGRSSADASTGRVLVHPEELHTLVRRLLEGGSEESESFGGVILTTLGLDDDRFGES